LTKRCFGLFKRVVYIIAFVQSIWLKGYVCYKPVFARLFRDAWQAAMTLTNSKKDFEVTGISPFNPGHIPNRTSGLLMYIYMRLILTQF
jgi:hypothetical protein